MERCRGKKDSGRRMRRDREGAGEIKKSRKAGRKREEEEERNRRQGDTTTGG